MTDIERAHALVKAHYPEMAASYTCIPVQIALAAIQSERERAKVLVEALRDIRDNGYYHPDYVPIVSKALAAYGDGHE